ncbi:hypothetical protein CTTA_5038 [Comamonas testosteroni]|uniref:Lipoprotein n=1 Tax=Comamonas testosteroni TaxID=285 RepID=A0A5A7MJZ5_COMTE|nr:hypothetical protein [Comamonas testosteroni]GEQ78033.1 hypothetical protein CTTA_5038 [Comamonas testosteroni]
MRISKNIAGVLVAFVVASCGGGDGSPQSTADTGTVTNPGAGSNGGGEIGGGKVVGAPPQIPIAPHPMMTPENSGGHMKLKEHTYVLYEDSFKNSSLNESTMTLTMPASTDYRLKVGDVLVTDAFEGLIVRITSRNESISTVDYKFENAGLTDALEELDFTISPSDFAKIGFILEPETKPEVQTTDGFLNQVVEVKKGEWEELNPKPQPIAIYKSSPAAKSASSDTIGSLIKDGATVGFKFKKLKEVVTGRLDNQLNGYFNFELNPELSMKMLADPYSIGYKVHSSFYVKPKIQADLKYEISPKIYKKENKYFQTNVRFKRFWWFINGFPVSFRPEFNFSTKIEGALNTAVNGIFHYKGSGEIGFNMEGLFVKDGKANFTNQNPFNIPFDSNKVASTIEVTPSIDFRLIIQGIAGPAVAAAFPIKSKTEYEYSNVWSSNSVNQTTTTSLKAKAGVDVAGKSLENESTWMKWLQEKAIPKISDYFGFKKAIDFGLPWYYEPDSWEWFKTTSRFSFGQPRIKISGEPYKSTIITFQGKTTDLMMGDFLSPPLEPGEYEATVQFVDCVENNTSSLSCKEYPNTIIGQQLGAATFDGGILSHGSSRILMGNVYTIKFKVADEVMGYRKAEQYTPIF